MESEMVMAIVIALLAISEALAFIPALKSNGILQLVVDICKFLVKGRD